MAKLLADRYRLGELLGRGGMGWVQRALDVASDHHVAIKFLICEDEPERLLTAYSWEVQAVARLEHPNLVRLYDYGQAPDGKLYIVMGLSPGTALHNIPVDVFTWPCVCAILEQILAALSHAHARGVFHHDLKPGNVLVWRDAANQVRLQVIDFGIAGVASELGRDSASTRLLGTASYMAPEVINAPSQHRFSPSADLYALGVMCYELAYGERPFQSDDPEAVLAMHVSKEPPLRDFRHGFTAPPTFHTFIRKLLVKKPRDRFATASDVQATLRQLAPPTALGGQLKAPDLPGPRFGLDEQPPSQGEPGDPFRMLSVRPNRFAGREADQAFLWGRLTDAIVNQRGGVILLTAPPGIGKSRLVRDVAQMVAEQGRAQTAVAPYALGGSDSTEGLRAALLALLGYTGARRQDVATSLPDDLRWLGLSEFIEPQVALDVLMPQAEGSDAGDGRIAYDWVGSYLRLLLAIAKKKPVLIALDDAALADDSRAVELLEFLMRQPDPAPVLVVVTMRSDALDSAGEHEAELSRLTRYPGYRVKRLEAMTDDAMSELLDGAIPLEPGLREQLCAMASGLPIYCIEVLRWFVRSNALESDGQRYRLRGSAPPLPDGIRTIWSARLDMVSRVGGPLFVELLEQAAVLGQPFSYDTLAEMCTCAERPDLLGALGQAWSTWQAEGLWILVDPRRSLFAHKSLWETVLERLAPAREAELNRLSGLARMHVPVGDQGVEVLAVARHFERAGLPGEAFPFYTRAAREAARVGRHPAVLAYCKRSAELLMGLGATAQDRRWAQVYRLLAESLMEVSRFSDVEQIATRLAERAEAWKDELNRAIALRLIANARHRQGLGGSAESLLLEARDMFSALGVARELGYCELDLGRVRRDHQGPEQVREHYRLARRHFAEVHDARGTALSLVDEALLLRDVGEFRDAEHYLDDAFAIFRKLADKHGMAEVLRHRGWLALQEEQHGKALDAFGEASHIYRLVGARDGSAACLLATGHAHRLVGQVAQADHCFRTARDEYIALGNRSSSINAHLGLVHLAVDSGHFEASLPHLAELLREISIATAQRAALMTYVLTARCLAELGRWVDCFERLDDAGSILQRLRIHDLDVGRNLERIHQLADKAGQVRLALHAREAMVK